MKTVKKITAILLCVAMLTALFILPAAAADDPDVSSPAPVFLTESGSLGGIDFSAVIKDDDTINTGLMRLTNSDDQSFYAFFDPDNPGVLVFGFLYGDAFLPRKIPLYGINQAFVLRPLQDGETLYDDVASFPFTAYDAFDDGDEEKIDLWMPRVQVTRSEGETVSEMTLDFTPEWTNAPMLLDCADLQKTLTLYVDFYTVKVAEYMLQPTAFDEATGILTVSVLNKDGQVGAPMHDLVFSINDNPYSVYAFHVAYPEGLFRSSRNEKISSSTRYRGLDVSDYSRQLSGIEGLPQRDSVNVKMPTWFGRFSSWCSRHLNAPLSVYVPATISAVTSALCFAPAMPKFLRALNSSLIAYGHDLIHDLNLREWIELLRSIF